MQFDIGYRTDLHSSMMGEEIPLGMLDGLSATQLAVAGQPVSFTVHHGAGLKQLRAMDAAGYHFGAVSTLVRVRDHGVEAGYVAELHAIGYDGLTPDVLTRLRNHGVSAGFIRTVNHGGKRLSADELIRMRDRGDRD